MPNIPSICGIININPEDDLPCTIAWSNDLHGPPSSVGSYPFAFLPAENTIYHIVWTSSFPTAPLPPPVISTPIGTILTPAQQFSESRIINFQSTHVLSFVKTKNRINIPHVLTQEEIDSFTDNGIGYEIKLDRYIADIVAITEDPADLFTNLTQEEIDKLRDPFPDGSSNTESEQDIIFRHLFDQVDDNLNFLLSVKRNYLGQEYRLDNDSEKSKTILGVSGVGAVKSEREKDGTTKIVYMDPDKPRKDGTPFKFGDTVYITYIGIEEHYWRTKVSMTWQFIDAALLGGQNIALPVVENMRVSNYRFYEWELEDNTKLSGWRAVEAFNVLPNFVSPLGASPSTVQLGDYLFGQTDGKLGAATDFSELVKYLPADTTKRELEDFLDNDRASFRGNNAPTYTYQSDNLLALSRVHLNKFDEFARDSEWYKRTLVGDGADPKDDHRESNNHVYFNVHREALKKRDVDKIGIEASLAEEIEKDIKANKSSFFPFMDDPVFDNPFEGISDAGVNGGLPGDTQTLSVSNTLFEPVGDAWGGGNFTAIADEIGSFPGRFGNSLNAYLVIDSPLIQEKLDEGTKIIVENFFVAGTTGIHANLVSVDGVVTDKAQSVSCIADPSNLFATLAHVDGKLVRYNLYDSGSIDSQLQELDYRPDIDVPPIVENNDPRPSQFPIQTGFSGILGTTPGFSPGRIVGHEALDASLYIETSVSFKKENNKYIIDLNDQDETIPDIRFHARTIIRYVADMDIQTMMVFKDPDNISDIIDRLVFKQKKSLGTISIHHKWAKGTVIEIVGDDLTEFNIQKVSILSVKKEHAKNFLDGAPLEQEHNDILKTGGIFFESNVVSIAEDERSYLYLFFNDQSGNISCVTSQGFGSAWNYHYALIPRMSNEDVLDPFCLSDFERNRLYVFFKHKNKIFTKQIDFDSFKGDDEYVIIDEKVDEENPEVKNKKQLSAPGNFIRNKLASFVQGDINVEVSFGSYRAAKSFYTSKDVPDSFFSAIITEKGTMDLFYMGETANGFELQCQTSNDSGVSWQNKWELAEYGQDRIRIDEETGNLFVDTSGGRLDKPLKGDELKGTDPKNTDEIHRFGVNVHWSRLKKHKTGTGDLSVNSESEVVEIKSPYVYYQTLHSKVFLFYIYEECLLCKIFDHLIVEPPEPRQDNSTDAGIGFIKRKIERETKSYFIDGNLNSLDKAEIHRFYNKETDERISDSNIIFAYHDEIPKFNENRRLPPQRVCAYSLPNGNIRMFYKDANKKLKAAIWNGFTWIVEDMLRFNPSERAESDVQQGTPVLGGFGDGKF